MGHAVFRIICAHHNIFWHRDWCNHLDTEYTAPLDFPNCVDNFNAENSKATFGGNFKTSFYSVHAQRINSDFASYEYLVPYLRFFKQSQKEYFPFKGHRLGIRKGKSRTDELVFNKSTTRIYVKKEPNKNAARLDNINISKKSLNENFIKDCINHINENEKKCHYTVDSDNLFSADYSTFLKEYLKLCSFLDLQPLINSVRAFILLLNERQTR